MQFIGTDPDFRSHPKFGSIGETGGGIDVDGGGIHLGEKGFLRFFVLRHNGVGMAGTIGIDVGNSGIDIVNHADGEDDET